MNYEAVYRTAPATPGLCSSTQRMFIVSNLESQKIDGVAPLITDPPKESFTTL